MTDTITGTHTEFAARLNRYDGTHEFTGQGNEAHARMVVEMKAAHLASLNDGTRELGGVRSVDLVARTVTEYADESVRYSKWQVTA
jgi:hypothetical protein